MTFEEASPPGNRSQSNDPIIGETTTGLAEYLVSTGKLPAHESFLPIRRDALSIVQRCRPFGGADGNRVGLVVGYVQSGKTLSMTTVSAIARDNGCRIVVLLAGVTTNLLQQNADRFRKELRGAKRDGWKFVNSNDGLGPSDLQDLQRAVEEWRDPGFEEVSRRTFLYFVLKNHAHLSKLQAHLTKNVDLRGIPALILDDEADQAGLNTTPGEPKGSTTYRYIASIRQALPHHTYLQYTATPQAPLLIALDDMLSPSFAELVEPGKGYTGGQTFFGVGASAGIVKRIPNEDLFKAGSPPSEPPGSLLEALRIFFVGCSVAAARGKPIPRSMLVHPSPRQADHRQYLIWVQEIVRRWLSALRSTDAQEKSDVHEEFRTGYEDLSKTDSALPPFEALVQCLSVSLGRVSIKEVNSQDGSEVDWENADEHVLVGGEKLNRGFTVEGLTVTYMPRDAGDWNADTIQQRARFFGYKESYLGLCRLYLHPDIISAYQGYVRHEEDIRRQLAQHRGKPLREWRRAFFLDTRMRPTRRNVLLDPLYRIQKDHPWFVQEQPHFDSGAANRNAATIRGLENAHVFVRDERYYRHRVAETSLGQIFSSILLAYEVRGGDVPSWFAQLVIVDDILDRNPDARVVLMRMDGLRIRTDNDGSIKLHQGRSSSVAEGKYPGDAEMRDPTLVTVQIHWLEISNETIPALAVHIPRALRKDDVVAQSRNDDEVPNRG